MDNDPVSRSAARDTIEIAGWKLERRRRYVMPGWDQKRSLLLISGLALLFLAVFDATYYGLERAGSAQLLQIVPELSGMIQAQDRDQFLLVLAASVIALLGVILFAVRETHRTAGPLYNLVMRMEEMAAAGPSVRLHLRKNDHHREIESAFNSMAESLQARSASAAREVAGAASTLREAADRLAHAASQAGPEIETLRRVAADLERLREDLGTF